MRIFQNISLKPYNTFGIEANASQFVELQTLEEVQVLCQTFNLTDRKLLILGGGSNILLTKDFDGMAIKINLKGIEIVKENDEEVWVQAMAGESWHSFVTHCVEKNWGGLENLSLIPGCVGAAPMQNIGAYGTEIKAVFSSLKAVEIATGEMVEFNNEACEFGYRESVFKNKYKGKYIIVSVIFKLNKKPILNVSYGAIQDVLNEKGITSPTIQDISNAVIAIRQSKLPNPAELGNAGSFFKNPEIPAEQYQRLKNEFPEIPGYPAPNNQVKVPAGWLIEQCQWKGKIVGNTGAHKNQALVLVNYGNATGNEILNLAKQIQDSVYNQFKINISPEVNLID
jgi:UDP-N-acetylmuramate dehydrogenase